MGGTTSVKNSWFTVNGFMASEEVLINHDQWKL